MDISFTPDYFSFIASCPPALYPGGHSIRSFAHSFVRSLPKGRKKFARLVGSLSLLPPTHTHTHVSVCHACTSCLVSSCLYARASCIFFSLSLCVRVRVFTLGGPSPSGRPRSHARKINQPASVSVPECASPEEAAFFSQENNVNQCKRTRTPNSAIQHFI